MYIVLYHPTLLADFTVVVTRLDDEPRMFLFVARRLIMRSIRRINVLKNGTQVFLLICTNSKFEDVSSILLYVADCVVASDGLLLLREIIFSTRYFASFFFQYRAESRNVDAPNRRANLWIRPATR